jgi:predicted Zn-dependent peptidase
MFEAFLVGENFLEEAEKYSRVTYGEVNALAKRILSKERYAISTVYPKNK